MALEGNGKSGLAAVPEGQAAEGSDMTPNKSQVLSEATLLRRCEAAVEQCRRDLQDLRACVKAAKSHREKCAALLSAATTAVLALEDVLYSPELDMRVEKALQQLCTRVQTALDQAEAIVKVYGSMTPIDKLMSKMFSPANVKFEGATVELSGLARQGQVLLLQSMQSSQTAGEAMSRGSSGMAAVLPPGIVLPSATPTTARSVPRTSTESLPPDSGAAAGSASQQRPPLPLPQALSPQQAAQEAQQRQLSDVAPAAELGNEQSSGEEQRGGVPMLSSRRSFVLRDQQTPVEAMQPLKIYRGGRGHQVSAMLYIPPRLDQPGSMGQLWWYLSKAFTSGNLFVHDLSSGVSHDIKEAKGLSDVMCMHLDDTRGLVWTGHRNGNIAVWEEGNRQPLCEPCRAFHAMVKVITIDEGGRAWAGSDKGKVKSLHVVPVASGGVVLSYKLDVRGTLLWAGPGMPTSTEPPPEDGGMIENPHAKEPTHLGAVTAISAAVGRVWTSGGSSAFVCLREWSQQGEFIASTDLKSMGSANQMLITSPIVRVCVASPTSVGGGVGSVVSSSRPAVSSNEVPQVWQMLTVHDSGLIQVWTIISGLLKPILRIGERMAPARGVVVCEQLGALCTAHIDGRLLVRSLPHPKSPAGLKVDYAHNKVGKVVLPYGEQDASKSGLAQVDGGVVGVVTASNSASIKLWPEAELRAIAQAKGLALQSEQSSRDQWPVLLYKSSNLQKAVAESASAPAYTSAEGLELMQRAASTDHGAPSAPKLFSGSAGSWLIEFSDLTCSQIIGEGAFGKVFLGRWQETDVAIKMLGSLSALGLASGSIVHDESGGVKLSGDVQKQLEREVGLMVAMRHPNIILFMGVCLEPAAVVTEFCSRGSLFDLLQQARKSPSLAKQLDWPKRLSMALDSAKGMLYLHGHKPPIIHRDLKSPNLLVDKHWRAKVTDFNLSRLTEGTGNLASTSIVANNPRWQAPETITRQEFTKASDVYAFGLILWELMTWQLPFEESTSYQIMMEVAQKGERPPVPSVYDAGKLPGGAFLLHDQWVSLMQDCWAQDSAARPTFDQVITRLRGMAEEYVQLQKGVKAAGKAAGAAPAPAQQGGLQAGPHASEMLRTLGSGQAEQAAAKPGASPFDMAGPFGAAAAPTAAAPVPVAVTFSEPPAPAPSPFDAPAPGQSGSSFAALSPVASTGGQTVSSAGPVPVSPFGSMGGMSVSSAAPPPPSPFGSDSRQMTASSASAPPPSPFGTEGGQRVSSAAPPPPSPFGSTVPDGPVAQANGTAGAASSAQSPPRPSPFDSGRPSTMASNAPPPRSPFS